MMTGADTGFPEGGGGEVRQRGHCRRLGDDRHLCPHNSVGDLRLLI